MDVFGCEFSSTFVIKQMQARGDFPRDSAPNEKVLERVVAANTLREVSKRHTIFVLHLLHQNVAQHLLHQNEGTTIARVVSQCRKVE
jgi:hypothetical protein